MDKSNLISIKLSRTLLKLSKIAEIGKQRKFHKKFSQNFHIFHLKIIGIPKEQIPD